MEMPLVDASCNQRIVLKIDRLAIIGRRHPHISDQHVRQTPESTVSHILTKRQGLSIVVAGGEGGPEKARSLGVAYHVFSDMARGKAPGRSRPKSDAEVTNLNFRKRPLVQRHILRSLFRC